MSDAQALAIFGIAVPVVLVAIVGMIRGYHMHLKVWKPSHREEDVDEHGDD